MFNQEIIEYIKPLLIFASIYILIPLLHSFVGSFFVVTLAYINILVFTKKAFNKKLDLALFFCILPVHLAYLFFHTISAVGLGMVLSRQMEFSFEDGFKMTIMTLIMCTLCYLYMPLYRLPRILKDTRSNMIFTAIIVPIFAVVYFIATSDYLELMNEHRAIANTFIFVGISFITTIILNFSMKFIWRLKTKAIALKRLKERENIPVNQFTSKEKLEDVHLLSFIGHSDSSRVLRYIETHLNNFQHEIGYESQLRLGKLDNQILAAYLHAKILYLRESGVKCELVIYNYSYVTAKIKTADLLEGLDILIDEALESVDKENSDLTITLWEDGNGRPVIDIANKNEFITDKEIARVIFYEYSLKKKIARGLRRFNVIKVEYNCRFIVRNELSFHGEKYLNLSFGL